MQRTRSDLESCSRLHAGYCAYAQALPAYIFAFPTDPLLRSRFLSAPDGSAMAKSTCRLKTSTRETKTDNSFPTLYRLRERLPISCRRAGSNK
jgi:hypothetical protein